MNRKALLKHFLGIVIAVICLVIIGVFAGKLYGAVKSGKDIDNARVLIEEVDAKIKETGERGEFIIRGIDNWFLAGFKKGEIDRCYFKNCLCICESDEHRGLFNYYTREQIKELCQRNAICKELEVNDVEVLTQLNRINPVPAILLSSKLTYKIKISIIDGKLRVYYLDENFVPSEEASFPT